MSDHVAIDLDVRARRAFSSLKELQSYANRVGKDVVQVRRESVKELRKITSASRNLIYGARYMFAAFGMALDPFQTALVTTGITAVEAISEVAAAVATTGVGIPWAAVMSTAVLGISLITLPMIYTQVQEAREGAAQAVAFMEGLQFMTAAGLGWSG